MNYRKETFIAAPQAVVFGFHELPDAFDRLVPPWESATVVERADISKVGSRAIIEQKIFGIVPSRWVAEHTAYDPPRMFEDVQITGPFAKWRHRHIVEPADGGSLLIDDIDLEPPFSIIGDLALPIFILPRIEKMFDYRHRVTKEWCENPIREDGTV